MKKKLLTVLACLSLLQSNQTMPMWASITDRLSYAANRLADRLSKTSFNQRAGIAAVVTTATVFGITYLMRKNSQQSAIIKAQKADITTLSEGLLKKDGFIAKLQLKIQEINNKLKKIKEELPALKRTITTDCEKAQEETTKFMAEKLNTLAQELDTARASLAEAARRHPGEIADIRDNYNSQLQAVQANLETITKQLEEAQAQIQAKTEQAEKDATVVAAEKRTMTQQHDIAMTKLRAQHEQEQKELTERFQAEISELGATATAEKEALIKRFQEDQAVLTERFKQSQKELEAHFAEHKTYVLKQGAKLYKQARGLQADLQSLKENVGKLFSDFSRWTIEKFNVLTHSLKRQVGHINNALRQFSNQRFNPFIDHELNDSFLQLSKYNESLQLRARCLKNRASKALTEEELAILAAEAEAAEKDGTATATASAAKSKDNAPKVVSQYSIKAPARGAAETKCDDDQDAAKPQRILLISVHGTWAAHSGEFGSGQNQLSTAFITFAQELALATGADVDFLVYQWKGWNTPDARLEGGTYLANIIKNYYAANESYDITSWLIGHSHGGNVINYAAQQLKGEIKLDNAVMIATPVLEDNPHADGRDGTYNISSIINIWGDTDMTGSAGSILTSLSRRLGGSGAETSTTTTLRHRHSHSPDEVMRNIRLKFDSQYLNHITIKHVAVRFLPMILKEISDHYRTFYEFVFNIAPVIGVTGRGDGGSTRAVTKWTIQSSIEKDTDIAWKLIQEAPQYTSLVPSQVQKAYVHSRDYAAFQENLFMRQYNRHKLHGKPFKGHNILQELKSALKGDPALYTAIYGEVPKAQ